MLFSLALITVYFRESEGGTLHSAQRIGLSVAMPFEVAGERIARPFRDAWGWTSDLVGAKQENEKLRKQVEALRQRVIQEQTAVSENDRLRDETQMPVQLAESPLTCVAVGSGKSLEEFEVIHRAAKARNRNGRRR